MSEVPVSQGEDAEPGAHGDPGSLLTPPGPEATEATRPGTVSDLVRLERV